MPGTKKIHTSARSILSGRSHSPANSRKRMRGVAFCATGKAAPPETNQASLWQRRLNLEACNLGVAVTLDHPAPSRATKDDRNFYRAAEQPKTGCRLSVRSSRSLCACGLNPSAWPASSGQPRSWAQPSGSSDQGPTSPDTAPASCRNASSGGASAI